MQLLYKSIQVLIIIPKLEKKKTLKTYLSVYSEPKATLDAAKVSLS